MAIGSGLSGQFGFAAESAVGTAVTVTKFAEILSESLDWQPTWLEGAGLKAGSPWKRVSRVKQSRKTVSGDVTMEVADKGLGLLWRAAVGSSVTMSTQIGTSTAYSQIHVPDGTGLQQALSLTMQVGRPESDGDVKPFTYNGCKITGWEFSCSDGELAQVTFTVDGWDLATDTALASASYTADTGVFSFDESTNFKLGGTVSTTSGETSVTTGTSITSIVRGITIRGESPMATERFGLGNSGVKKNQINNGMPTYMITLDAEFGDRTEFYDLLTGNTTKALQVDFAHGEAASGEPFRLSFIFPACKVKAGSVNLDGPDVLSQSIELEAYDDGTNPPIQVKIVSTDTTL